MHRQVKCLSLERQCLADTSRPQVAEPSLRLKHVAAEIRRNLDEWVLLREAHCRPPPPNNASTLHSCLETGEIKTSRAQCS